MNARTASSELSLTFPRPTPNALAIGLGIALPLMLVGALVATTPKLPTSANGSAAARSRASEPAAAALTTQSASVPAKPAPSPTPGDFRSGHVMAPPPYFAFRRPFDPPAEVKPSRFYPYGTDADGEYLLHHGVDIGNPQGTPVLAIGAGLVVYAGQDDAPSRRFGPRTDFYGRLVLVEHQTGLAGRTLFSLYGHLDEVNVRIGQRVVAGDQLGTVGSTGIALGPHLHLEMRTSARDYASTLNPELFLAPLPNHGVLVVRLPERRGAADGTSQSRARFGLYAVEADGTGARWVAQAVAYPAGTTNSAWRWQESAVFGDLPLGYYFVRLGDGGASAGLDLPRVRVRPRGATLVVADS